MSEVRVRSEKKKTDAQKRYLAKKARKHRVLSKAKRDAAPKWTGEVARSGERDDSPATLANAEAGPSDHEDALREEMVPAKAVGTKHKKRKDSTIENAEDTMTKHTGDREVSAVSDGYDSQAEELARLERKRLKREKRDQRDRSARKVKRQKQKKVDGDDGRPDDNGVDDVGDDDNDQSLAEDDAQEDDVDTGAPVPAYSPPPLEAFPLPDIPTPADPALLTKQGLPKGLEHAQLVDPNLSASLDDLPADIQARLRMSGIDRLFAVQAAILPRLLTLPLAPTPYTRLCDYLASAPTGSGKTLAYVLPIVHILSQRVVTKLRALIVLPTRDLVQQVRETLEVLAKGTGLTIGTVAGQHSFAHEQSLLGQEEAKLDILIATPGRLIDHLNGTPGFTLSHLRFLVIDEADRLLGQSYHDWLARVLESTTATCQKMLFSATLTRDPAAIASLKLQNPQYLIVQSANADDKESFALPEQLTERYVVTLAALKPLVLIHLLRECGTGGLVFTKSVDSTTRLVQLLSTCGGKTVRGYTSEMKPSERKAILSDFSAGKVDFLICSDLVARGMDLPMVSHVISYDVPMDMRKYVHRVGRTARAGRTGTAWTVVEKQEALHFKAMLKGAGRDRAIKRLRLQEGDLESYRPEYETAMAKLKVLYHSTEHA